MQIVRGEKMATKKKAFGGYQIRPDEHLAKIIGKNAVSPAEMTKKLWQYVKAKKLASK
jgi:chromatin remodeling complex protein RSC6